MTVFLLELIGALSVGHAALFVSKPRGRRARAHAHAASASEAGAEGEPVIGSNGCRTLGTNGHKLEDKLRDMVSTQRALAEKIAMAHHRLAEIERSVTLKQAVSDEVLQKKFSRLEHFRANTEVEITALKEILERVEKTSGLSHTEKYKRKIEAVDKNLKDLEKDLHRIIYRSKAAGAVGS